MAGFISKHGTTLRALCLLLMMVIPFLLYFTALGDNTVLLYFLLALIGGVMALTMKVG